MISVVSDFLNRILSVFSTFRFTDFLDILLVAAIIYLCVRIIRETRAMQLAKGIIFLLGIYLVVNLLDMEASTYIFRTIFTNILIIIAILFIYPYNIIIQNIYLFVLW